MSALSHEKSLLSVDGLNVTFQQGNTSVAAVRNMSYSINPKEIVGIVGESGSGKSVGMLGSLRLLPPHARTEVNSIVWEHTHIEHFTRSQMKKIWGNKIGYIYQEPTQAYDPLVNIYTTFKELFLAHYPQMKKKEILQKTIALLTEVGIDNAAARVFNYFHQFSGGMIQRVQIALAIALNPALLIADEPTTALDVTTQTKVVDLLLQLCAVRNMAMIFITHDLALASSIVDRLLVMKQGQIVEDGTSNDVLYHPTHEYTIYLLNSIIHFGERHDN